jgi:hypothetical protein
MEMNVFDTIRSLRKITLEYQLGDFVEFLSKKMPMHIFDSPIAVEHGLSYEKIISELGSHSNIVSNILRVGQLYPILMACKNPPNCDSNVTIIDGYTRSKVMDILNAILLVKDPDATKLIRVPVTFYDIDCMESERNAVVCLTIALSTYVAKGLVPNLLRVYERLKDVFNRYGVTIDGLLGIKVQGVDEIVIRSASTILKILDETTTLPHDVVSYAKSKIMDILQSPEKSQLLATVPARAIVYAVIIAALRAKCYGSKYLFRSITTNVKMNMLVKARKIIGDVSNTEEDNACISKIINVGKELGLTSQDTNDIINIYKQLRKVKPLMGKLPAELAAAAMYAYIHMKDKLGVKTIENAFGVTRPTMSLIAKKYILQTSLSTK